MTETRASDLLSVRSSAQLWYSLTIRCIDLTAAAAGSLGLNENT